MVFAQLRNVDETVDVILQLHESAKAGEFGHFAGDQVTDLIFLIDVLPRIVGELFDAQADALIGLVDVDDFGFDFFTFLKDLHRMVDFTRPTEVGHVDHAVDAVFQFHKGAVGSHVADAAFDAAADGEFLLYLIPGIRVKLAQA